MKKLFALLLAVVMMMSLATVAFAEGEGEGQTPATPTMTSKPDTKAGFVLNKLYVVAGQTADKTVAVVPNETLTFKSTPDASNPDTTKNLTIANLAVTGTTGTMEITLPTYDKVGKYEYVITENAGTAQGATYSTEEIKLTVLVTYDYADADGDTYGLATQIVLANGSTVAPGEATGSLVGKVYKLDTFTNNYDMGSLAVSKEVTGNMASQEAYFDFVVTFISDKPIASDITITPASDASTPTTIAQADWTVTNGISTKTVNLKLKHGDTVTFDNIPAGVLYTVTEDTKHIDTDGSVNPNSAADAEYTASYKVNGANEATPGSLYQSGIEKNDEDTVDFTNEKSTGVDTGILMDSAPYVVMLLVAAAGLVLFTNKRRVQD